MSQKDFQNAILQLQILKSPRDDFIGGETGDFNLAGEQGSESLPPPSSKDSQEIQDRRRRGVHSRKLNLVFSAASNRGFFSRDKKLTQLGSVLAELGVEVILARTAECKGRIERFQWTMQNRLVTDLAMEGITTPEEANAFFPKWIEKINGLFAVKPQKDDSLFVPCKEKDLRRHLRFRIPRKTRSDGSFSVLNYKFRVCGLKNQRINFCMSAKDGAWCELPRDASCKRHEIALLEMSDTYMPYAWQDLLDKFFFSDLKTPQFDVSICESDISCGFA